MVKRDNDYVEVAYDYDTPPKSAVRPIGMLRLAKVTYDHIPIESTVNGTNSIGRMVDQYIAKSIKEGSLINEVSLFFETREQQEELANLYR
jgi:hypothetical protein